jgi:hypothetical protein
VLEAVLWILNTGVQWHMLPQSYPNYDEPFAINSILCTAARQRRA